jgi:hypothetical protein
MQPLPIIPLNGTSADLEAQHFELTRELFELKALLRSSENIPSGRLGHLRNRAKELETQIELMELALGEASSKETSSSKNGGQAPPRSKRFLEAFYAEACRQLPSQLRARLEQAAAKSHNTPLS